MDHKYFAYGSNLIFERITERLGKVKFLGAASIENWCLRFNKLGADGSGKCNIIESQGEFVHGILYQISPRQKEKSWMNLSEVIRQYAFKYRYWATVSLTQQSRLQMIGFTHPMIGIVN